MAGISSTLMDELIYYYLRTVANYMSVLIKVNKNYHENIQISYSQFVGMVQVARSKHKISIQSIHSMHGFKHEIAISPEFMNEYYKEFHGDR